MQQWLRWLEASDFAVLIRDSIWLYPAVETLHIIGFSVLVGSAAMFDVRLLATTSAVSVTQMGRQVLPWSRRSLLLVVPTGVTLFATQATALAASPVFRLKLVLIALAGVNAALFHARFPQWDEGMKTPFAARMAGASSLVLWIAVITCGRLLAYY